MSVNDPIGDMLARIRNAQERGKTKVATPASRLPRPRAETLGPVRPSWRSCIAWSSELLAHQSGCAT